MKRSSYFIAAAALALAGSLAPAPADAQQVAQVRGTVVDEQGQPVPDVNVELKYTGEGPKHTYNVKTNKKGGFIRVGLPPGPYEITFTKEGYQKYGVKTGLSMGGVSDICKNYPKPGEPCEEIVLKKGGAAAAAAAAPGQAASAAGGAEAAAAAAAAEDAKKLGAAYGQAIEAIKSQSWDEAETLLKDVETKIPDQPQVHFNLGYVYRQKKDYANAESEYKKAAELSPTKPDAYVALADMYAQTGKAEQAAEYLGSQQQSFQNDATFLTAYGAMAMNAGKEKEAEEAFSKVLAIDPGKYQVQFHLATLALNRNETDDAIQHLQAFIAAAPPTLPDVEVAKNLLTALQSKKK
jgi:Flp pilus assembly protein TadD